MVQAAEQPSPARVLPSSHPSVPRRNPSPQLVTQGAPGLGQLHPGSVVQVEEQPSRLLRFPSSQVSLPLSLPSPQIAIIIITKGRYLPTQPELGTGHLQPSSKLHLLSQPSLPTALPSSHSSLETT